MNNLQNHNNLENHYPYYFLQIYYFFLKKQNILEKNITFSKLKLFIYK